MEASADQRLVKLPPRRAGYSDQRLWPCYGLISGAILLLEPYIGLFFSTLAIGIPALMIVGKVAQIHNNNPQAVAAAHERGMQVIPWTVNTLDEMQRLKALGVDGVITDYPDLGVELLK